MNCVIKSLKGSCFPLDTPLVNKTVKYLSNQFQIFLHSLWRNIPPCVLSHSHRYFEFFVEIIRIRDDPGIKQVFPYHIYRLTNLTSPVSLRTIRIPRITQTTMIKVWLNHWYENIHINLKQFIARLRLVFNNVKIFIIWRCIPASLF